MNTSESATTRFTRSTARLSEASREAARAAAAARSRTRCLAVLASRAADKLDRFNWRAAFAVERSRPGAASTSSLSELICENSKLDKQRRARTVAPDSEEKDPLTPTRGARRSARVRRKTRRRGRSRGRTAPTQKAQRERELPPAMHSQARRRARSNGRIAKLHSNLPETDQLKLPPWTPREVTRSQRRTLNR